MNKATKGAGAVAALTTAALAATKQARKVLSPHDPSGRGRSASTRRMHVVTVNLPIEQVRGRDDVLARLRALDGATLDLRPAPADKGTELSVTGDDHGAIRQALRDTKALIEVGEVVLPTRPGSSESTLLNAPLRAATAHAKEGGRL